MKKIILIITILLCTFLNFNSVVFSAENSDADAVTHIAEVVKSEFVENNSNNSVDSMLQLKQLVTVKFLNGDYKGEETTITNMVTGNPAYDIITHKGDKLVIHEDTENGNEFFISDIYRLPFMFVLLGMFAFLLIFVGKKKGLLSLVSIFITCWLIFSCLSPMILHRVSPIFATLIICLISTAATMYLVGGFNYKSTSACLGTFVSIIFALILSIFTVNFAHITGFSNESCTFLFSSHPELDLQSIAVSAILIATLGAAMDVAMSISSAINEFYEINDVLSIKELFKSGMNVGKDIIGTMANTLILVYLGGALPMVLLSENIDFQKFFNLNQIVTEISAALIGSITLLICVPVTAIISAALIKMKKSKNNDIILKDKEDLL